MEIPETSLALIFVAGVSILLALYTDANPIVVWMPSASGNNQDKGRFQNVMLLCSEIEATHSFKEFLPALKRTVAEAIEHQALPLQYLAEVWGLERDLNGFPQHGTLVTHRNLHDETFVQTLPA